MKSIYSTVAIAVLSVSALAACERKPADGDRMPDNTPAPSAVTPAPAPVPDTTAPAAPAAGGMGMGTSPTEAASDPMMSDPASTPASAG
jgi:hypothetical protein